MSTLSRTGVITLFLTAAVLAGCETTRPSTTPSGRVEEALRIVRQKRQCIPLTQDCAETVFGWAGQIEQVSSSIPGVPHGTTDLTERQQVINATRAEARRIIRDRCAEFCAFAQEFERSEEETRRIGGRDLELLGALAEQSRGAQYCKTECRCAR